MNKGFIPDFIEIDPYEPDEYYHDYHSTVTIQLSELIDDNWVKWYSISEDGEIVPDPDWVWDYYNLEQYKRLCDKFNSRFMFDEISMLPPGKWRQQLIRKINELMPKYKPLYKMIDDGIDPLQVGNEYGKSRNIFSEFPETLLNGNSDYVSTGTDREYEVIKQGNLVEQLEDYAKRYYDIDVMILNELEIMFTSLYSVSTNGW